MKEGGWGGGGGGTGAFGENRDDELQKKSHTTARQCKYLPRLEPAIQQWW